MSRDRDAVAVCIVCGSTERRVRVFRLGPSRVATCPCCWLRRGDHQPARG